MTARLPWRSGSPVPAPPASASKREARLEGELLIAKHNYDAVTAQLATGRRLLDEERERNAKCGHAAEVRTLRNEKSALVQQLRDTARERDRYLAERDAARVMLAAARRQCAAGCEHAQEAAARLVQLAAMQTRLDEYQAREEARDSPAFMERVEVPRQRRRTS